MLIPDGDVAVESKPVERRDFTQLVAASDIDPDAKLRPYVCGLCCQLSDQTTNVGTQTEILIGGRHCPTVRVGCRTCIEADGKPCPVVWRYSKCTRDEAATQFGTSTEVQSWDGFSDHAVVVHEVERTMTVPASITSLRCGRPPR